MNPEDIKKKRRDKKKGGGNKKQVSTGNEKRTRMTKRGDKRTRWECMLFDALWYHVLTRRPDVEMKNHLTLSSARTAASHPITAALLFLRL